MIGKTAQFRYEQIRCVVEWTFKKMSVQKIMFILFSLKE